MRLHLDNKRCIYVIYTDDSILVGPDPTEIEEALEAIKATGLRITIEGDVGDFLGVKIDRLDDQSIQLTQPHLIDSILSDPRLASGNVATKGTPAASSKLLRRGTSSPSFDG